MTKRRNPLDRYALDIAPGELTWIGVRPKRREPLKSVPTTKAVATLGLEGDHRMGKTPGSGRQVSIISEEFIAQAAHFLRHGTDQTSHQHRQRTALVPVCRSILRIRRLPLR